MRNQKKTRRNMAKTAGRIIALSLIMAIWTTGAGVAVRFRSCPAVEGRPVVTVVSAEAAVRSSWNAASADAADSAGPAEPKAEKKDADQGMPDKIKEKLPDIDLPDIHLPDLDFSKPDSKAEKEKLREAVRKMDEIGISPERLVQRAWKFLNRKDNREKIDEAVEDIRDRVQDKTEKAAGQEK